MAGPTPDTEREDSAWAEALAGRPPEDMDPKVRQQAELLRAGLQRRKASLDADIGTPSDENFERLLFRLRREGLNSHRSWNIFGKNSSITWGIAASLVLAVAIVFELQYANNSDAPNSNGHSQMRGDNDATTLIVSDPTDFKQKITAALMNTDSSISYSIGEDGSIRLDIKATQSTIDALAEINLYPSLKNGHFIIVLKKE